MLCLAEESLLRWPGLARNNKVRFPYFHMQDRDDDPWDPTARKNGVIDWTDNRTPALGWFPFPFSPHKQCYSIGTAFM